MKNKTLHKIYKTCLSFSLVAKYKDQGPYYIEDFPDFFYHVFIKRNEKIYYFLFIKLKDKNAMVDYNILKVYKDTHELDKNDIDQLYKNIKRAQEYLKLVTI